MADAVLLRSAVLPGDNRSLPQFASPPPAITTGAIFPNGCSKPVIAPSARQTSPAAGRQRWRNRPSPLSDPPIFLWKPPGSSSLLPNRLTPVKPAGCGAETDRNRLAIEAPLDGGYQLLGSNECLRRGRDLHAFENDSMGFDFSSDCGRFDRWFRVRQPFLRRALRPHGRVGAQDLLSHFRICHGLGIVGPVDARRNHRT